MKLTEENFQTAVKVGGVVLGISAVASLYLVMRNREVFRDQVQMETVLQQAINQQQVLENVMREFAVKTSTDPKIADIFQRNQLMSTNAPSAPSPSAKE